MKKKIEFTHNGSFLKRLWLLVRSLANIGAFAFFWYAIIVSDVGFIVASTAALTLLVLANFIFPLLKRK